MVCCSNLGSGGGQDYHISKLRASLEIGGGLDDPATFLHTFLQTGSLN